MATPTAVELKAGQKWKVLDLRFDRVVEIVGPASDPEKVQIRTLSGTPTNKITEARRSRFNGRRGGYKLVE